MKRQWNDRSPTFSLCVSTIPCHRGSNTKSLAAVYREWKKSKGTAAQRTRTAYELAQDFFFLSVSCWRVHAVAVDAVREWSLSQSLNGRSFFFYSLCVCAHSSEIELWPFSCRFTNLFSFFFLGIQSLIINNIRNELLDPEERERTRIWRQVWAVRVASIGQSSHNKEEDRNLRLANSDRSDTKTTAAAH
jgi:hypothetical protein